MSRPLISKKLVEIAHQIGATTIVHGCTGKGNDQVRFEVANEVMDMNIKVIGAVREWNWSREKEIDYAKKNAKSGWDKRKRHTISIKMFGEVLKT